METFLFVCSSNQFIVGGAHLENLYQSQFSYTNQIVMTVAVWPFIIIVSTYQ